MAIDDGLIRTVVSIVLGLLLIYLGWVAFLLLMQRSMMFPGRGLPHQSSGAAGVPSGVEELWISFGEGRVEAVFLASQRTTPSPAVIFAHGNAEVIGNALEEARDLRDLGLSVLLLEYPGYGRSDGRPSRSSISEVFRTGYDWLASRPDVDPERIVGMGRSLGGGAITDLARQRRLQALVLQSTFTSVADFARGYFVPSLLARDRFDNLEVLRSFARPVLLVHGTADQVIPHLHSERLARSGADVQLLSLECGHNNCPPDRDAYLGELRTFLLRSDVLEGPQP